jgi:hypothetical protein
VTHTTIVEDRQVTGGFETVVATVDITSLDNANNEAFSPSLGGELNLSAVRGAAVVGVENADSYVVQYDHLEGDLYVEGYGGTDPTGGTDVGEVRLRVDGDPAP